MDAAFWKGRKVFLTGHTGFKGSWLSLWLESLGAEVWGYALAPATRPNLYRVARVEEGIVSILGDLADGDAVTEAIRRQGAEIIIHMGAQSLVRRSYREPVETFATNVQGTVHVLEAARRVETVRAVVVVTSDKCYENREWPWSYRENDPMGGHDPYSASKGCAELVVSAYRNAFLDASGVMVASARAGNVIGGGDWSEDRLVPDIIRAFGKGETVSLRSPGAIRPWQHVLDPLHGYLLLAERLVREGRDYARGWNFGPDARDTRTVAEVTESMAALWGDDARWHAAGKASEHEAHLLRLDSGLAQSRLGWRPALSLEQALAWTVQWYLSHRTGTVDMRALTLEQIRQFDDLPE
uniref:CDP-glucose 4,6-dehydratase n=1 Tax=Candidatus Kentrum sp. FM TaxID=2126340 RepID=A0A450SD00_9GAMM|nr:MAG: CDP-glucose 4,6-dehydratase [Candidatus Kentron sp. FM]VFJ50375.1 MAG: CDP-glucose 4,6-dehydratase [Candidatus Kentron sp. FM]VFK08596.1 MAG: CDP-glucose 4,6-dehydratase [Candidatus Kentron sp. FM]